MEIHHTFIIIDAQFNSICALTHKSFHFGHCKYLDSDYNYTQMRSNASIVFFAHIKYIPMGIIKRMSYFH
jgi:hypothetical protein